MKVVYQIIKFQFKLFSTIEKYCFLVALFTWFIMIIAFIFFKNLNFTLLLASILTLNFFYTCTFANSRRMFPFIGKDVQDPNAFSVQFLKTLPMSRNDMMMAKAVSNIFLFLPIIINSLMFFFLSKSNDGNRDLFYFLEVLLIYFGITFLSFLDFKITSDDGQKYFAIKFLISLPIICFILFIMNIEPNSVHFHENIPKDDFIMLAKYYSASWYMVALCTLFAIFSYNRAIVNQRFSSRNIKLKFTI